MVLTSAVRFLSPWIDGVCLATSVIFLERHGRGLPFRWSVYINMSLKTWLIAFAVSMLMMNAHSFPVALGLSSTSMPAQVWSSMGFGVYMVWKLLWDVPLFCRQFPSVCGGFINHRKCRNKESSPIGVLIWILTFSFLIYIQLRYLGNP